MSTSPPEVGGGDEHQTQLGHPAITRKAGILRRLLTRTWFPRVTTRVASRTGITRARKAMLVLLLAAIVLAIGVLGTAALQAHTNRAQLDHELTHARIDLSIPDRLLRPIISQEQRVTGGAGGLFSNYWEAATTYRLLYTQLLSIERTVQQTVQQQAQADLQACQVFQASIDLLRQYGDAADAASFQQQHDEDVTQLAAARQLSDYLRLAQTITTQNEAIALPLLKAKAGYDFTILRRLVDYAQTQTVINPADHKAYPIAPEYADPVVGIGDAANKLRAARTFEQYQSADFEITSLTMGLRAQLEDRTDPTPHNQPHQTDLQVMQYYNVTAGRVAIISLAEQTARFYENGKLVYWTYVTTGRPEHPSVPGYHVALLRVSPTLFVSQAPRGSPEWYAPTPIHYAIEYNTGFTRSGGTYFLHDAWWRSQFGPYSNLPHYDPVAFNGGSLGCVNVPLATMRWIYPWILLGTPIILY